MSKDLERKNSFGSTIPTSLASTSGSSRKNEKAVPHYLRAPTGSCHDLCKYGHKNPSEEAQKPLRGRRKNLNNLSLNRSAILDGSKDVRNKNLSLTKSSISLGGADHIVPNKASSNSKGSTSSEHLVPRTASSVKNKIVNTDDRKKHPMVAQRTPTNPRYSNGILKFDEKAAVPVKGPKLAEKTLQGISRTAEKTTNIKKSSIKRPASFPSKLNLIEQVSVQSQPSDSLASTKDKKNMKEKLKSSQKNVTGDCASSSSETGRSSMSSSNTNNNGKERLDMPRSSFSIDSELTASVVIQVHDLCIDKSQPALEKTRRSVSEEDVVESNKKIEASAGEFPVKSSITLELQQSFDDQELKVVESKSDPEHKQAEQNVGDGRTIVDEDNQIIAVENKDVYYPVLTESISEIEDGAKINIREEMGTHEEGHSELLTLDEQHAERLSDFTSGNAAQNVKADETAVVGNNTSTSHCQPVSDTSSDGELLEEPKSVLIEPSDSTVEIDELASANNDGIFEQDELKSTVVVQQLPEELSDDEFYEEYDSELSESDESDVEGEEATINKNTDESSNAYRPRLRRNSTALHSDDSSATPYKLKFKRGKIVELKPDSIGPRRLKFRRGATNEVATSEGQSARRIYKRNSCTNSAVPTNPEESPGVKLRHQDTQEKKDAQGLFNNVIEETASKLVESRKSKVKALVGAFETVISLQDGKPTSSTPQAGNSPYSVHGDSDDDEKACQEEAA